MGLSCPVGEGPRLGWWSLRMIERKGAEPLLRDLGKSFISGSEVVVLEVRNLGQDSGVLQLSRLLPQTQCFPHTEDWHSRP